MESHYSGLSDYTSWIIIACPGNNALTPSVSLILDYACIYATVPDTDAGVNAMVLGFDRTRLLSVAGRPMIQSRRPLDSRKTGLRI